MQANLSATNDGVPPHTVRSDATIYLDQFYQSYIAPYYKVDKYCRYTEGCMHKYGVVKNLKGKTPKVAYSQLGKSGIFGPHGVSFIFMGGRVIGAIDEWSLDNSITKFGVSFDNENNCAITFYIDVNGLMPPNVFGKDIYIMVYSANIGSLPAGYSRTFEEVKDNCENGDRFWCLSYVLKNNFKISDVTWKR